MRVPSTPTIPLAQTHKCGNLRQEKWAHLVVEKNRVHPPKTYVFAVCALHLFFSLYLINSILPLVARVLVLGGIKAIENFDSFLGAFRCGSMHCCYSGICLRTSDERSHTAAIVTCDERRKQNERQTTTTTPSPY